MVVARLCCATARAISSKAESRRGPCPHCGRTTPRISSRLSRVSSVHSLELKKVKGTLINLEQLGRCIAGDADVEEWQVEIRKKDNDPHELDELIVWVAMRPGCDEDRARKRLVDTIKQQTEVSPNAVHCLGVRELLDRVGMEREMKEKRFVDSRRRG